MQRRAFNFLPGWPARHAGRAQIRTWLVWTALVSILAGGCAGWQNDRGQGPAGVTAQPFVRQFSIKETTVLRLENGWAVGVESISSGQYVDAKGKEQRGRIARIGVWNDTLGQADSLRVYEGMIFPVGEQRFQVIKLKPNSSLSAAPGSSNGYIVIGQLEDASAGAPETGNRMSAQPILIDSPQQDRTLVITVDANRDDPTRYLTLVFEVRDKATQAILHRQQTHASSRLAWSMRWLDNSVVQLQSSDVGTSCWQEQQDGTWSDARCP